MIYDEWTYPAGIVGGQLYSQHPEMVGKSLEEAETDVTGPAAAEVTVPGAAEDYTGAVLMNLDTHERRDVSDRRDGSVVRCGVPTGRWKLMAFYLNGRFRPASQKGGAVIGTSKLPTFSAEAGRDREVGEAMEEIFGMPWEHPMTAAAAIVPYEVKDYFIHKNPAGGRAYFIPRPDPAILQAVLKECDPVRDVNIQEAPLWPLTRGQAYPGALTYLHKVKGGHDVYFFSNTTEKPADVTVALRGDKTLAIWDPHTGERSEAQTQKSGAGDQAVTSVRLVLGPVRSEFFVQE
jgi:hypothetical protein